MAIFTSKVALFTYIGNFCLNKWKPHWALIQVMPSEAASSNLCSLQGHWEPFFTKKILVYIWPWTWAVISKFPVLDTFEKKLRENNINWNYYVNSDVRICDAPIMFRDQQTLNNKWQFKSQTTKKMTTKTGSHSLGGIGSGGAGKNAPSPTQYFSLR